MRFILRNPFVIGAFAAAFVFAVVCCAQESEELNKTINSSDAPSGIDEGLFVPINGVDQWITIRGTDLRNPVLLRLHGGPGFPSSQLAPAFAYLEKDFTVVQWDQPGGGATYAKNMDKDIGPLTIERYRRDGIAVAEYALKRLSAQKLILYGTSWGSLLGVEMAHARPELFSAYVGISQTVGKPARLMGYELAIDAARERGDKDAVAALEKAGPPPYERFEDYIVRQQYVSPPGLPPRPDEKAAIAGLERGLTAPPEPNAKYIAHGLPEYDGVEAFLATIL